MLKILNGREMKERDSFTIREIGVPSAVLMERAALACAGEALKMLPPKGGSVIVVCGSGNNGGDGYACGRILRMKGLDVRLLRAGNEARMTEETSAQKEICGKLGIPESVYEPGAIRSADLIVDALFGIGLSRGVTGVCADLIAEINCSGIPVLSIDIPSGVHADNGQILGIAVRADVTVTMQCLKPGLLLFPGASCAGDIRIADIGVDIPDGFGAAVSLERGDLEILLPERDPAGNKGTFGKVLIAAGSPGMAGAAFLSASSALRSGAGMVRILTCSENRTILQQLLPEAVLSLYDSEEEAAERLIEGLAWCDVCVCGPGIGTGPTAERLVSTVTDSRAAGETPVVIDADGLNALRGRAELLDGCRGPVFITPHILEMQRLSGIPARDLKADPVRYASEFAGRHGVTCILKDARTVTACPDGTVFINRSGNDGMGTAGSGDVLTGILAGLIAGGTEDWTAGALAVFIHGLAGDDAAERLGRRYMTSGDITEGLKNVLIR